MSCIAIFLLLFVATQSALPVQIGIIAIVLAGLALEFWALFTKRPLISRVILNWSLKYPIIPFAVGVLCGHWFWPMH